MKSLSCPSAKYDVSKLWLVYGLTQILFFFNEYNYLSIVLQGLTVINLASYQDTNRVNISPN